MSDKRWFIGTRELKRKMPTRYQCQLFHAKNWDLYDRIKEAMTKRRDKIQMQLQKAKKRALLMM